MTDRTADARVRAAGRTRPPERWDDWREYDPKRVAAPGREALHAGAHDLLQLRGGLRAAGLRRQGHDAGPQVRGQPAAPRLARPQLRQGARHHQPDPRPGADPVPAASGRARAARGDWSRVTLGRRCSTRSAGGSARPSSKDAATRSCTTWAAPGHERTMDRVLKAWGIDGHNSHTNVCSASARLGLRALARLRPAQPRPRERALHPPALVAPGGRATTSTRTPSGSSRASSAGAKLAVMDPRLSQHRLHGRLLAAHLPGQRGGGAAGHGPRDPGRGPGRPRLRRALDELARVHGRRAGRARRRRSRAFVAALREHYREFTPAFAEAESGVPRRPHRGGGPARRRAPAAPSPPTSGGAPRAGNLGGWQVARALQLLTVLTAQRGHAGRDLAPRLEQVQADLLGGAAGPEGVERAALPDGVAAQPLRDVVPAAALPEGGPRPAGRLLHARLQPRLDEPGRDDLDGGADATSRSSACTRPSLPPGARPRPSPTTCCRWGTAGERHDIQSQETHSGRWVSFRQPVLRAARERLGRDVPLHLRGQSRARSGRRTSSGSSSRGASIPTGALGIRRWFESPYRPGEKLTVDEYYRWIFENAVPGLPEAAARGGPRPARLHAAATGPS